MNALPEIVIALVADDWAVLYVDGKNVYEGHTIEPEHLANEIPGLSFRIVEAELPDDDGDMYPSPPLSELTITRIYHS